MGWRLLCLPRIVSVALNAHPCGTLITDLIDELATLLAVDWQSMARRDEYLQVQRIHFVKGEAEFPLRKATVDATGLFRLSGASLVSVV